MSNINGKFTFPANFYVVAESPLDTRMLVDTISDLTSGDSWNIDLHPPYNGMLVVVKETGDIYILQNKDDTTNIDSWRRIVAEEVVGITSITGPDSTGLPGTTDTYKITLTDETEFEFSVYNGQNGISGENGITPIIKAENDFWWISYDNGENWEKLKSEETEARLINTNTIQVAGGPLSQLLLDKGITELKADNLQKLLESLFCVELWPENVSVTNGTVSGNTSANSATISVKNGTSTLSSGAFVYPNTTITVTATQSSLSKPTSTPSKITGLTYGYSWDNDNTVDNTNTSVSKSWTITQSGDSTYKLVVTINGTTYPKEATSLITNTQSFNIKRGANTCNASSYGLINYSASVEGIPKCYWISNLGNTDSDKYTSEVASQQKSISCGNLTTPKTTSTITIYGTLPVFHNVKNSALNESAVTEMSLTGNTSFTIQTVPPGERTTVPFIFEFPGNNSVKTMSVTPLPSQYRIYSNSTSTGIGDSCTTDHGAWSTSIEISAAKESGSTRFAIEFPASANLTSVQFYNPITRAYETYSQYKTEEVKRDSDSYIRLTMTHSEAAGESKYKFGFSAKSSYTTTDYTIEDITKTVNGVSYAYKRLKTTDSPGFVTRTITLNKTLYSTT